MLLERIKFDPKARPNEQDIGNKGLFGPKSLLEDRSQEQKIRAKKLHRSRVLGERQTSGAQHRGARSHLRAGFVPNEMSREQEIDELESHDPECALEDKKNQQVRICSIRYTHRTASARHHVNHASF